MRQRIVRALASCFYVGYLPAPGAWGSAVGLAIAWYSSPNFSYELGLITLAGYWLTVFSKDAFSSTDPAPFVLDEVCGMMLSVLFLPKTWAVYAAAFVVFRVLDVWKPWPISILQNMKNSFSIMHDDLAAGFFANLIVHSYLKIF